VDEDRVSRALRGLTAVVCALVASFVVSSFISALLLGTVFDGTTEQGKTAGQTWLGLSFFALWALLAALYWRARSIRRIFGWTFLTCGLATLGLPVATAIYSAALTAREATTARAAGAALGGSVLTLGLGVLAFFFGAILLVIAFVLLSGGRPVAAPARSALAPAAVSSSNASKKCPDCAETVQADARICRFCRHEFG
jgi:hypothetical protein